MSRIDFFAEQHPPTSEWFIKKPDGSFEANPDYADDVSRLIYNITKEATSYIDGQYGVPRQADYDRMTGKGQKAQKSKDANKAFRRMIRNTNE